MANAQTVPVLSVSRPKPTRSSSRWLVKYFYLCMSLLIATVVVYGFSHTVETHLIHAVPSRPVLLWVHGILFSSWVAFFILQSALVRLRKVRLHRTLGWVGAIMGVCVIVVGFWVPSVMVQFDVTNLHRNLEAGYAFLIIAFCDMSTFTICFGLAVFWRRQPELHRRLLLLATCAITSAAWARMPFIRHFPPMSFYFGVDALVVLGALRDLFINRRIHAVYRTAFPLMLAAQGTAVYIAVHKSAFWLRIMHTLLG